MDTHSPQDLGAALKENTTVDIKKCYQCGKCSAGCPLAPEMDLSPNRIIRMIQTGDPVLQEKVLRSLSIWLCLSCEMCYSRCPMSVDIPKAMDFLREKSMEKGFIHPEGKKIVAFHKSFLNSVENSGRLYEIGLLAGYKLKSFDFLQDMDLAPAMFAKGKLHILPEKIKDRKAISTIYSRTLKRKKCK